MHCQRMARGQGVEPSGSRDDAQLGQTLPRQAQDQGIELRRRCERQQGRRVARARPDAAPRVESARRAPHAEAVVHQQLDARAACVREQIAIVLRGRHSNCEPDRKPALLFLCGRIRAHPAYMGDVPGLSCPKSVLPLGVVTRRGLISVQILE